MFVFLTWSLPGATGMFALSLGVQRITNTLPGPVYALLSGLNASTVGIIALAAVQLAEKAIKDKLTRILVIGGACAGMCFNALWYFPVLMVVRGLMALIWDLWALQQVGKLRARMAKRRSGEDIGNVEQSCSVQLPIHQLDDKKIDANTSSHDGLQRRLVQTSARASSEVSTPVQAGSDKTTTDAPEAKDHGNDTVAATDTVTHAIPVTVGLTIVAMFFGNYPLPLHQN